MGLAVVPDELIDGYIDWLVKWPNSPQWKAILRGLLQSPIAEEFYDPYTGDAAEAIEAILETLANNMNLVEGSMIPSGFVGDYAGGEIPIGWLLCDGSEISRTEYANLFAAIGTTYGMGDGSTTFELPYCLGRVSVCRNIADNDFNNLGDFGGQKAVTLEVSEIPELTITQNPHSHTQTAHTHIQNSHSHILPAHSHTQTAHTHILDGGINAAAGGIARGMIASGSGSNNTSSQASTPAIQNASPTIANETATNQSTTATNQSTTATNQSVGGGIAHNNIQPYLVFNRIIKI